MSETRRRPQVALVVGSGALKCLSALGALQVLQREDIPVDCVVACSGGAFTGIFVAEGRTDMSDACSELVRGWEGSFDRISYASMARALLPGRLARRRRMGLIDDRRLNHALRDYVGEKRFADLQRPLHIVATDFMSGEQVILSDGLLFDALRATISIPLVLPAWEVGGRPLVDGALCAPLPVDVAIREGADIIIAIGFEDALHSELKGVGTHLTQMINIVCNQLLRSQFAFHNLAHHSEIVPIVPAIDFAVGLKDLHRVPQLVALGAEAAEREVGYLKRLMKQGLPA